MKKIYFSIFLMLISSFAFSQWFPLISGTANDLRSVYFTDANNGYAVGIGPTILKTTNGGINWWFQYSENTSGGFFSVHFSDANKGIVVGSNGVVLNTTNGGANWSNQASGTTSNINSVYFSTANTGYSVAYRSVFKTTNGGTNWTNCATIIPEGWLQSIYFTDVNTGYVVGNANPPYPPFILFWIKKTINGGSSWSDLNFGSNSGSYLYSIYFYDANIGCTVGESPNDPFHKILKTTNGGLSWSSQTAPIATGLWSVCFPEGHIGYSVGRLGTIINTTNGGINWVVQTSGSNNLLYSVYFPDAYTGYIVGQSGIILKTTNGGGVFINEHKTQETNFTIYPNPASNQITINLQAFQVLAPLTLQIYNLQGQVLLQQTLTQNNTQIEISQLQQGVYIAKVKVSDGSFVQEKFVVVK